MQGTKETIQKAGLNTNNVSDFQAWVIRFFSSQVAPQFFAFSKVKMKIQSGLSTDKPQKYFFV